MIIEIVMIIEITNYVKTQSNVKMIIEITSRSMIMQMIKEYF